MSSKPLGDREAEARAQCPGGASVERARCAACEPELGIYIAGPYSTDNDTLREHYIQQARTAQWQALAKGWRVASPITSMAYGELQSDLSWQEFMDNACWLLRCCKAILLLPGWEQSKGARIEKALAEHLGMAIYQTIESLPDLRAEMKGDA